MKHLIGILALLSIGYAAPSHADNGINVSIQTGVVKCVPMGDEIDHCETMMNKATTTTLPYMSNTNIPIEITMDDQKFTALVTYAFSVSSFTITLSFPQSDGSSGANLTYNMSTTDGLIAPLSIQDAKTLVKRTDLETDSYRPILIVAPAPAN